MGRNEIPPEIRITRIGDENIRILDLERKTFYDLTFAEWNEFDSDGVSTVIKKYIGVLKRHDLFRLIKKFEELDVNGLNDWQKTRLFI